MHRVVLSGLFSGALRGVVGSERERTESLKSVFVFCARRRAARFFTEIRLLALLAELLLMLCVFAVTSRHSRTEQVEKGCGKL